MIPLIEDISLEDMHSRPYEVYKRLRKETPVARLAANGRVMVTRYDAARLVKMDQATFSSEDWTTPAERAFQATSMMRLDGPKHMAERRTIQPALSARLIGTEWKQAAEESADRLLAKFSSGQTVDLFEHLAAPFAGDVLRNVLGLLDATGADIVRWSQVLINGAGNVSFDEDVFKESDAVNGKVNDSIDANIKRLEVKADNSILHAMTFGNAPAKLDRIRCNIKVAIGGGVNEPRDALLTALYGLLTNPDQLAQVKDDPAMFAVALEEAVRWIAPIQTSPRKTTTEVTLDGVTLPPDTPLLVIQASANRDEEVYENGELFDINRKAVPHQAFGNGPHFCMGTHLARMSIGQVMLPRLFDKFPNISIPDPMGVPWYGFTFRGPTALQVRL